MTATPHLGDVGIHTQNPLHFTSIHNIDYENRQISNEREACQVFSVAFGDTHKTLLINSLVSEV